MLRSILIPTLRVVKAFGLDVITDLCDQLHTAGVPGIHFYTMNQAGVTSEIIRRLHLA